MAELAGSLPMLFEASRWWCGRSFAHARKILSEVVADGPLEPQFDHAFDLGLPRRVFCLVSGEAKPVYVDFQSPALTRNLHRTLGRAAAADPNATVHFSEMLPGPDQCWLEHDGVRYTSELRIVAVDRTRRGHGSLTT